MSKIYTNANIHTEEPKNPKADTVVIDGGKFTFVGKSADMVVLDRNIYEISAETIHDTLPLITVFKGEEVYKA